MKTHAHENWLDRFRKRRLLFKKLNRRCLLLAGAIGCLAALPAEAALINGDFSDDSLLRYDHDVPYSELSAGWTAKNAFDGDIGTPDNWQITGGVLEQVGITGGSTRASQFFTTELTGGGWSLNFDTANETLIQVQLFAGVDDGNNASDADVYSNGDDNPPEANIVTGDWTKLVDMSDLAPGSHSIAIAEDLSGFDIMVIKFRGVGSTIGLTLDNVQFTQVPEPGTAGLFSLGGACALALRRRRRKAS